MKLLSDFTFFYQYTIDTIRYELQFACFIASVYDKLLLKKNMIIRIIEIVQTSSDWHRAIRSLSSLVFPVEETPVFGVLHRDRKPLQPELKPSLFFACS